MLFKTLYQKKFQITSLLASKYFKRMASTVSPKECKIPIPGGSHLAAKVWGSGRIPVIASHGWLDNAGTWDTLIPLLTNDFTVVAFDFAGHGQSSPPPLGVSGVFASMVLQLERVIQHFGWHKVNLLGHSMGGGVSMLYAGTFPEKVDKLIIVDLIKPVSLPAHRQAEKTAESITDLLKAEEKLMYADAPQYGYDEITKRLVAGYGGGITKESAEILLKRGANKCSNGKYSFTFDPRMRVGSIIHMTPEQQKSYAERIKCDMLLIKASEGPYYEDKALYKQFIEIYEDNANSFQYLEVEGTHHVHLNNPQRISENVSEFLLSDRQMQKRVAEARNGVA